MKNVAHPQLTQAIPLYRDVALEKSKKAKTALTGKSGPRSYYINPAIIDIISDEKHALFCPRIMTPVDEEFVDEMDERGNEQPVKITKIDGKFVCVWGRRRVIGTRLANQRREENANHDIRLVLAMVDNSPLEVLQDQMIRENESRRPSTEVEQAFAIGAYIASGRTNADAMRSFGVTEPTLRNRKRILKLSAKVLAALRAGKIKLTHALALHQYTKAGQDQMLAEYLAKGGKVRKKRAPHSRPKPEVMAKVLDPRFGVPDVTRKFYLWTQGEVSTQDACNDVPGLAKALEGVESA